MKTRKLLALALSVLMIISVLPATIFAAPSAVTVTDTAHEHNNVHDNIPSDEAYLAAEGTLEVKLYESFGDTWNGATLLVYKSNVLEAELTIDVNDVNEQTVTVSNYNSLYEYDFVWVHGEYDSECNIDIILDGETVFTTTDKEGNYLDNLPDNNTSVYVLESTCEHSVPEGSLVCSVCSISCGVGFDHKFTDSVCSLCRTECGAEISPHDWSNKDGICKVCGYECPEHDFDENYVCTNCTYSHAAIVISEDGISRTPYKEIGDAISAAQSLENCTVKLLDDIFARDMTTIGSGKFSIDLNGKTWESTTYVLYIKESSDIKIIATGGGKIISTEWGNAAIMLIGTPKLEIAGGTIIAEQSFAVSMDDRNPQTSPELVVSGGQLEGYSHAINAFGTVTITGGEINSTYDYDILFSTGTLDFSGYANVEGLIIEVDEDSDVSALNLILPEGFVIKDFDTEEEVTQLVAGGRYTISNPYKKIVSVTTQDGTTTTEYTSIAEAFTAAASLENSTVKLLDNISATSKVEIESGKFTIDLNGKTWQSTTELIIIRNNAEIKICDSSENADGMITTEALSAICLWNESKLEIDSGNFSCSGDRVIDMSVSGNETSSELLISGGKFVCNSVAQVAGRKVTLTGGEFECAWGYPFEYLYGTLDLSDYEGTSYMGFYVAGHVDASALELILPEGAIIKNVYNGEIVTELSAGGEYGIEFPEISAIEIDLGEKADATNIRYAEIDGVVTEIEEADNKYTVAIGEENLLIEVVEKTADGEFVKSQYFYVDMTQKTATKLSMDSYMTADGNTSIRTNNPMGMRFKSTVLTSAKNEETQFVIDEYGFIVATEEALAGTELTLDFSKYVTGVAYNKEDGTDIVFDRSDDEVHIFTGYLKNIPVANYKTNLVCKTYTKLTVDGKQFTLYGEAVVGNVYDTAKKLLEDETLDTETKNALINITLAYENTIGIPGDDLYPET